MGWEDSNRVPREQQQQQQQKRKPHTQLPKDIIENEILMHLPPGCLVRFQCVCKSWQSLLSDHEFVRAHLTRQRYSNDQNYLVSWRINSELSIVSRFRVTMINPIPFITKSSLVGSINGLICFTGVKGFTLWNPVIRKYKEISNVSQLLVHARTCEEVKTSAKRGVHQKCSYLYGFGWDPIENDYKVVIIYTCIFESKDAAVYSFKSNSWTQLVLIPRIRCRSFKPFETSGPTTIVRGCPYWSYSKYVGVHGEPDRHRCTAVFKFVAEKNEFRLLPNFDSGLQQFTLINLKDFLAGMAYKSDFEFPSPIDSVVDIYCLDHEESSGHWNKMYTVGPIDCSSLLCWVRAKGEWWFQKLEQVLCYDPKTNEIKDVVHNLPLGIRCCCYSLQLVCFSYTPSLVFIHGMKSIMHSEYFDDSISRCYCGIMYSEYIS